MRARVERCLRACAVAAALGVSACAGNDADTRPVSTQVTVPLAAPRTTGADSASTRAHKQVIGLYGGEYHAQATERYLNEILGKLSAASDAQGQTYRVTILNSPIVNAFALPTGDLYVTRGLLALANDTAEVAAVMAHEIAHITARHAMQRAELERQSDVISKAAAVIENPDKSRTFQSYAQLSLASFSRQQEYEADEIGVRVIAKAGYDPYGASRFLDALGRSSELRKTLLGHGVAGKPDIMSTHPSTPERIARAVAVARQIGAPGVGEVGRDRYLAAIEGLAFGDDPAEGVVRGRVFMHPKLGFTFTAPPGFVLENSAEAVLGVADQGAQAVRLDRVHVASDTTLETYLGSGWIDGLQQSSVESLVVNGLPAATASAKGTDWMFRLAAVRFGPDVYRLIFAAKDLSDEDRAAFRASLESFRKLSPDETVGIKPQELSIVTAEEHDTVETMASRMAVPDKALDSFILLNGLEPGSALQPGTRYKVVVN